jgi:hypothetical protein
VSKLDEIAAEGLDKGFDKAPKATKTTEEVNKTLLQKAHVDYTQDISAPPTAMKINGSIFGTLGNFSLVIGKAKSKKTFLITMALAGAIRGKTINNSFAGTLPEGKERVVYVDTEQSTYHVVKVAQRVLKLTGTTNPDNFDVYGLRPFSTKERNIIIEQIIEEYDDLGLLVIDGVRDIVSSINDEEQATNIANKLLKWTAEKDIHIVTVLHQNKGDFNARGHLGSELVNKAEMTVSVTVQKPDTEVSKVEAEYCRHKAFNPFAIRVFQGMPKRVDGWQPKDETKARNSKLDPSEVNILDHKKVLRRVEKNIEEKPNYSEMVRQITDAVQNTIQSIGSTKAQQYFTHYQNKGLIKSHGKKRSSNRYYSIDLMGEYDE